jgi:hypothetical protein
MAHAIRAGRIFFYLGLSVLAVLALVVGVLRYQQRILRHRAERLLADIQQIDLRKTSFEDAQTLFLQWKRWGRYDGECTPKHCVFKVAFEDFWHRHPSLRRRTFLERGYEAFGGRPTEVYAGIQVFDGVVWEKWFGFGAGSTNASSGEMSTAAWLPAVDERFRLHPNYRVEANLPYCENASVQFTPYEDPMEIRRLSEFNLSPLTHWGHGAGTTDVMPTACAQARKEAHLITPDVHSQPLSYELSRNESLEYLARDALKVAVVKVLGKRREDAQSWRVKAQIEVVLKRYSQQDLATIRDLDLQCQNASSMNVPSVGERYLIFTNDPGSVGVTCGGMVPANEENLAVVRRGAAQDYEAVFNKANIGPR